MPRSVSTCIYLTILIFHIAKCDGMLESVKESLNGLMNYTAEVLPYLHKGVKMVQQAEQFVDSAIGEDCTYECDKEGIHSPTLNLLAIDSIYLQGYLIPDRLPKFDFFDFIPRI